MHKYTLIAAITAVIFYGCSGVVPVQRYADKVKPPYKIGSETRFESLGFAKDFTRYEHTNDSKDTVFFTAGRLESIAPPEHFASTSSAALSEYLPIEKVLTSDIGDKKEKLMMEIVKYMDTPYKWGGTTRKGIDCSAFIQNVFNTSLNTGVLRVTKQQYKQGEVIENREDLQFGDLVFFNTRRYSRPGHVGIYLGDGIFVHSGRRNGVALSSLEESYYDRVYMGARRLEHFKD